MNKVNAERKWGSIVVNFILPSCYYKESLERYEKESVAEYSLGYAPTDVVGRMILVSRCEPGEGG